VTGMPSSALDREAIEAEIDRLRSLGLDNVLKGTYECPRELGFAVSAGG
jgi:hypothetical protein